MLKRIKSFIINEIKKVESSNPYGFGLLRGYEDYYGSKDERKQH